MQSVEIVTLIKTTLTTRGDGVKTPVRPITQYWDMDGKLIFEVDPCTVQQFLDDFIKED